MDKAVFLDRDGVINRKAPNEQSYITRWEDFQILNGVIQAVSRLNRSFRVIVVTNQRAVAKGLMTTAQLESLHDRMCLELQSRGARIDGVFYCPHDLSPPCTCRKPEPGMLLEAARMHSIDLANSWMVGDSEKDIDAGKKAGCRTVRLIDEGSSPLTHADLVAPSLLAATSKIFNIEGSLSKTAALRSENRAEATESI
jgi:D-glycero-D-manno-heptose 1,7-bisphosphate phosphatase